LFSNTQKQCKNQSRLDNKNYLNNIQNSITTNRNFIKSKTTSESYHKLLLLDDLSADNGQDIVDMITK